MVSDLWGVEQQAFPCPSGALRPAGGARKAVQGEARPRRTSPAPSGLARRGGRRSPTPWLEALCAERRVQHTPRRHFASAPWETHGLAFPRGRGCGALRGKKTQTRTHTNKTHTEAMTKTPLSENSWRRRWSPLRHRSCEVALAFSGALSRLTGRRCGYTGSATARDCSKERAPAGRTSAGWADTHARACFLFDPQTGEGNARNKASQRKTRACKNRHVLTRAPWSQWATMLFSSLFFRGRLLVSFKKNHRSRAITRNNNSSFNCCVMNSPPTTCHFPAARLAPRYALPYNHISLGIGGVET